jgi:light-harvesting complex 1 beta chain
MATATDKPGSLSGLTPEEAQEFHGIFQSSFIIFIAIAIVAHLLAWIWRPWLPGPKGYTELMDGVSVALHNVLPILS